MIGFHIQGTKPGWLEILKPLPARTPFLSVNDIHACRDAKTANPGLFTIFRKYWDDRQRPFSGNLETDKQQAREYFDSFIDGTWMQQELWRYVDAIKELNEYFGQSADEVKRQLILVWLTAVQQVWRDEYNKTAKTGGRNIPLVCVSAPVGNSIDPRFAKSVADFGNILSYHGYTFFRNGERDPLDWQYHSGRWAAMDAEFAKTGIKPKWIATESGIYNSVLDGWKSNQAVSGNLQRYIDECIKYQLDHIAAWNKQNGNRFLGSVLFTFGNDPQWQSYDLTTDQALQIARAVANHAPVPPPQPPPPAPPTGWKQELWGESVANQPISLNPAAALQAAIFRDGFVPVQGEKWVETADGVTRARQGAEHLETGERRVYYAIVPHWNNVQWFTNPAAAISPFVVLPAESKTITQYFGENPDAYIPLGFAGHEGIDFYAPNGSPYFAVMNGVVEWVSDQRQSGGGQSAYGWHIVINHGNGMKTIYAHAKPSPPVATGLQVSAGDVIGYSGNTGNSTGYHLHFSLKIEGRQTPGYPAGYVDPLPYLQPLLT